MKKIGLSLFLVLSAVPVFAQTKTSATQLPEVTVHGTNTISENDLVGDNHQPEWTTQRRFPTTRIYVLAPWQAEFEQWWKGKFLRGGGHDHLFQSEVELGLPHRFQLDFYENVAVPDKSGPVTMAINSNSVTPSPTGAKSH